LGAWNQRNRVPTDPYLVHNIFLKKTALTVMKVFSNESFEIEATTKFQRDSGS